MAKKIVVQELASSSVEIKVTVPVSELDVHQKPVESSVAEGTRADIIETQSTGPQGPPGQGSNITGYTIKHIGSEEPDTTEWQINDLWYDTSTE